MDRAKRSKMVSEVICGFIAFLGLYWEAIMSLLVRDIIPAFCDTVVHKGSRTVTEIVQLGWKMRLPYQ